MILSISLNATTALARLDSEAAPRTCAALAGLLPFSATAHYAKIAGQEFYTHLPLLLEVERRSAVTDLPAGAVAFWPERQLFCVYYGHIYKEDATVTLLGSVVENLDGLAAEGEAMRAALGRRVATVTLGADAPAGPRHALSPSRARSPLAARALAAYAAIAHDVPADVTALLARRGAIQPAGPLVYADAETRKFHETLWVLRQEMRARGEVPAFAVPLLRHYAARLGGWCGLAEAQALAAEAADALPRLDRARALEATEAVILYAGRLNLWLDAHIPWTAFNEALEGRP